MAKARALESKLAQIRAIDREAPPADLIAPLRSFLADKSNFVVAEAAEIVGQRHLTELVPDLVTAFRRFLENGAETDPMCKAKIAIITALDQIEHDDEEVFLLGFRHRQPEPVWGKTEDTAPPLRGAAAFGLVWLHVRDVVYLLAELLNDSEKIARCHAAQALGALASQSAVALLRFKAMTGDEEPEVVTECLKGLIAADPTESLQFVAEYLNREEEIAEGAALAIADSRKPEAFEILKSHWPRAGGDSFPAVLLLAIAITRQAGALEFLLEVVTDANEEKALAALSALAIHKHNPTVRDRIGPIVAKRARAAITAAFKKTFGEAEC